MWFPFSIALLLLVVFTGYITGVSAASYFKNREDMLQTWKSLSEKYKEPGRKEKVESVLQAMSGVYSRPVDFGHQIMQKLVKTVLMTVIEVGDVFNPLEKYYQYLFNFLCHIEKYDHRLLVYIVAKNATIVERNRQYIQSFNPSVEVLDYPHQLFWDVLQQKDTNIFGGRGRASYANDFPSFHHFGGYVKTIPVLEVLRLGFNVLVYDVDIVYLEDPVPYILYGDADFVFTPELRSCLLPSLDFDAHWDHIEPNTGTFFIRSNPVTIAKYERSLRLLVITNVMNEQGGFIFQHESNATWTKSCDPAFDFFPTHLREQTSLSTEVLTARREGYSMKYCFLSEFAFHNGVMELGCAKGTQWLNGHIYELAMAAMALPYTHTSFGLPAPASLLSLPSYLHRNRRSVSFWDQNRLPYLFHSLSSSSSPPPSPSSDTTHPSNTDADDEFYHLPFPHYIQFHTNYCGHKWRCMHDRHLWLYQRRIVNERNDTVDLPIHRRRLSVAADSTTHITSSNNHHPLHHKSHNKYHSPHNSHNYNNNHNHKNTNQQDSSNTNDQQTHNRHHHHQFYYYNHTKNLHARHMHSAAFPNRSRSNSSNNKNNNNNNDYYDSQHDNNYYYHRPNTPILLPAHAHPSLPQGGVLYHSCHLLRAHDLPYAKYNWTDRLSQAIRLFDAFWQEHRLNNATLVKFDSKPDIFYVEYVPHKNDETDVPRSSSSSSEHVQKRELLLRVIRNDSVLRTHQWTRAQVQIIGDPFFYLLPFGEEMGFDNT